MFHDRENPLEVYGDEEVRVRYRLRPDTIMHILGMIGDELEHPTQRNMALPPLLQLTVCLRFLASGSFLVVVGDTLPRVSKATVCRCVQRVTNLLSRRLNQHVKFPQTDEERDNTKREFYAIAGIFLLNK